MKIIKMETIQKISHEVERLRLSNPSGMNVWIFEDGTLNTESQSTSMRESDYISLPCYGNNAELGNCTIEDYIDNLPQSDVDRQIVETAKSQGWEIE